MSSQDGSQVVKADSARTVSAFRAGWVLGWQDGTVNRRRQGPMQPAFKAAYDAGYEAGRVALQNARAFCKGHKTIHDTVMAEVATRP